LRPRANANGRSSAQLRAAAASSKPQVLGGFGLGEIVMPLSALAWSAVSGAEANAGKNCPARSASIGGAPAAHSIMQCFPHSGFGVSSGQQGMLSGIALALPSAAPIIVSCCVVPPVSRAAAIAGVTSGDNRIPSNATAAIRRDMAKGFRTPLR